MTTDEFVRGAEDWRHLGELSGARAIARACRGSGDPAALAWLAESLELDESSVVVDIGGGLGGCSAWLHAHYGCRPLVVEPVADAARCARSIFGLRSAVAVGSHLPLRTDSVHAALVLGVLSVVDDPIAVLEEAHRVAPRLGLLAYLSTGDEPVVCGGSKFLTRDDLCRAVNNAGWELTVEPTGPLLPTPPSWNGSDGEAPSSHATESVVDAIEAGQIDARVTVAQRIGAMAGCWPPDQP